MKIIIAESRLFTDEHSHRLLNRISQIETELYKNRGNFDVVLAGIVDFGEALGKFGRGVKPLVDRMGEIRRIIQPSVTEYQKLASPDEIKLLPAPEE